MTNFIIYGSQSTEKLTWNERFYLIRSYISAFGHSPKSEKDWLDIVSMGSGQRPPSANVKRDAWAKNSYKKYFGKKPEAKNIRIVDIIGYGLASKSDNDNRYIGRATSSFEKKFRRKPKDQNDWNMIKAIASQESVQSR
jgi:hypothetical protein